MNPRVTIFIRRFSREIRAAFTVAAYANFGARRAPPGQPGRHGGAARHNASGPDAGLS